MKQLRGYKPKRSGKPLLHLLIESTIQRCIANLWEIAIFRFDLTAETKKHHSVSSILNAVSSFNMLLLAKKYQTLATHTGISQHFINFTSPIAVISVNVMLFAFRRDSTV